MTGNIIDPSGMPTFYTPNPVWITLARIKPQAKIAWTFLAEHANVGRQMGVQNLPCPKMDTIAEAIGTSRKQLRFYLDDLVDIGALEIEEYRYAGGMRRGYRYKPIFNPPADYDGPTSLKQFYDGREGSQFEWMMHRQEAANTDETAGQPGGSQMTSSGGGHPAPADSSHSDTVEGGRKNPAYRKARRSKPVGANPSLSPSSPTEGAGSGAPSAERDAAAPSTTSGSSKPSAAGGPRSRRGASPRTADAGSDPEGGFSSERSLPSAEAAPQGETVQKTVTKPSSSTATRRAAAQRAARAWVEVRESKGAVVPPAAPGAVERNALRALREYDEEVVVAACRDMALRDGRFKDPLRHLEHFSPGVLSSRGGVSAGGGRKLCKDHKCRRCLGTGFVESEPYPGKIPPRCYGEDSS
ncbi:hypothetical protein [Streptomyces sp. 5-10]|uniref:hypothetical protein n=1 Tax=Streptomyces sp. 5-10 TaxID=878925 RepID=UPI00168B0AD3|nr:hypothetical protein [Streptomyces sp. 5-10]MBD3004760.1 hypothetical protein [Streptomyces sp. 5-10]